MGVHPTREEVWQARVRAGAPCHASMHYGVCNLPAGHGGKHSKWALTTEDVEVFRKNVQLAKERAEVLADFFEEHGFHTDVIAPIATVESIVDTKGEANAVLDVRPKDERTTTPFARLDVPPAGPIKVKGNKRHLRVSSIIELLERGGLGRLL